ncbi:MAG: oxygen-dependent coproporphyrinogen oxidase [Rhodospirillales bacterium]
MSASPEQRAAAATWFDQLRDRLIAAFEAIEADGPGNGPAGSFEATTWQRPGGGGGVMSLLRGRVLEKAGVNVSVVDGRLSAEMQARIPGAAGDPRFWASGVSVVVHPCSPHVPAAHMNTRMIATTHSWFGGGADLTPVFVDAADTNDFHAALKAACERLGPDCYPRFKKWCDEYFFLPHRGEARGQGGIFFDDLATGDWERDFAFVRAVGEAFLDVYPRLIRRHKDAAWSEDERLAQLIKRGRYAEFNLLYDRGTQFGLKTGGNPEAILMSLPPMVAWP